MASKIGQFTEIVWLRGQAFQNRDVCMEFSQYLKTCSLVTFLPKVLKLGKAGNSDMFFHVMDHIFVIN